MHSGSFVFWGHMYVLCLHQHAILIKTSSVAAPCTTENMVLPMVLPAAQIQ